MRDVRLHTRAHTCMQAGERIICRLVAGWRAAHRADGQRLRIRPGFEHHPLESGALLEGRLRCTAHTHTPSQARQARVAWPKARGLIRRATDATTGMCGVRRASSGVPTDELAEGAARLHYMDAGACASMQACTCRMYYVRTRTHVL